MIFTLLELNNCVERGLGLVKRILLMGNWHVRDCTAVVTWRSVERRYSKL